MKNGEWVYSEKGAAQSKAEAGTVEAWVWGGGDKPTINPTLKEICDVSSAAEPTAAPTLAPTADIEATAAPTQVKKTEPAQSTDTQTATSSAPLVSQNDNFIGPLLVFGLVVIVLVGVLLFLRSRR